MLIKPQRTRAVVIVVAVVFGANACSDESDPAESCEAAYGYQLADGTCAGVTLSKLCNSRFCTSSLGQCQNTYYVSSDGQSGNGTEDQPFSDLPQAAQKATSGDCVVISAGKYTGGELNGGVQVHGAGAGQTVVVAASGADRILSFKGGKGGALFGVTLEGASIGLVLSQTDTVRLEQVRIHKTTGVGLYSKEAKALALDHVVVRDLSLGKSGSTQDVAMAMVFDAGTVATATHTLVQEIAQLGLVVSDAALTMSQSAIAKTGLGAMSSPGGVVVSCSSAGCPGKTTFSSVEIEQPAGIGMLIAGAKVDVVDTTIDDVGLGAGQARGLSVQAGAELSMTGSTVQKSLGQGVVADASKVVFKQSTISANQDRGLWLQNIATATGGAVLDGVNLVDNLLIGVGGTNTSGVQITGGKISGTTLGPMNIQGIPVDIGDGVQALAGSSFTLDSVALENNGRLSVLFDGSTGAVKNSTFTTGVPEIVEQNGANVSDKVVGNKDTAGAAIGVTNPTSPFSMSPDPFSMPTPPMIPGAT